MLPLWGTWQVPLPLPPTAGRLEPQKGPKPCSGGGNQDCHLVLYYSGFETKEQGSGKQHWRTDPYGHPGLLLYTEAVFLASRILFRSLTFVCLLV